MCVVALRLRVAAIDFSGREPEQSSRESNMKAMIGQAMTGLIQIAVVILAVGLAVTRPAVAQDDPRVAPLFNAQHPLSAMLTAAQTKGKALVLVLRDGVRYTGKIKDVGTEGVIVTGLAGKEFFDAWVRLDSIVAMEERVRMR